MSLPDAARGRGRHLAARRRRRRARLGGGRPVGGARGPAGAQRARRHQGRACRRARRSGPRAASPVCSTRATRSRTTSATRSKRVPGCATRPSCASWSTEAPKSIRYLMRLGAAFDPEPGQPHDSETIALTREGGHSHNRIVHAGGDRSGAEVQRTLDESAHRRRRRGVEPRRSRSTSSSAPVPTVSAQAAGVRIGHARRGGLGGRRSASSPPAPS